MSVRRETSVWLLAIVLAGAAMLAAATIIEKQGKALLRSVARLVTVVPDPTGPYSVVTKTIELKAPPTAGFAARTISAQIWMPDVREKQRPASLTAAESERFPVLIYLPSWGGRRDDNSIIAASLSSHGYVVVAVDDVMFDDAEPGETREQDADRTAGFDFSSAAAFTRTLSLMDRRVVREARKASRTVDALTALQAAGQGKEIARVLDLDHIGVFGLSFGGSAAAEAPLHDARFRTAVNMDGWHFGDTARKGVAVPYFMFNSIYPWPGPIELGSRDPNVRYEARLTSADLNRQTEQVKRSNSYSIFIDGTAHEDFSNELFFSPRRVFSSSARDRSRIYSIIEAYLVAFFETYIRNKPVKLLAVGTPPYAEVKYFSSMARPFAGAAMAPANPG